MKATPTEYKGVRFRSKSEAMFARYLELLIEEDQALSADERTTFHQENVIGNFSGGFIYEPKGLAVDGWTPDFLTWTTVANYGPRRFRGLQIPVTHYRVIEYKPSRPTQTYIDKFRKRSRQLFKLLEAGIYQEISSRCSFELFYGSVYTSSRGMINDDDGVDGDSDWLANYEDCIRDTRFDLECSHAAN